MLHGVSSKVCTLSHQLLHEELQFGDVRPAAWVHLKELRSEEYLGEKEREIESVSKRLNEGTSKVEENRK